MCCREGSKKIIPFQKNRIQIGTDGQAEKAAVYPPFLNPCFNFAIIPQKKFILDIGIILLKFPDDTGEPMCCNTGKGSDANQPCGKLLYIPCLLQKRLIGIAERCGFGLSGDVFGCGAFGSAAAGGDESPAASGRGMHLRRRYACGDEWEKDKVLLFRIKEAVKHSLVSPLLFVQAPFST